MVSFLGGVMRPLNVLSLFDGISCGRVALERANVPVNYYFASEIDKYAIQITQKNYPDIIQLGDVTKVDWIPFIGKIDLLIGGSPCQDLSCANRDQKGLEGSRSGLFFKFLEALQVIKPRYFLLENVASMSEENKNKISELLGVKPILINSALVSAQNRKRLYWCNWNVSQPEDKRLVLANIIDEDIVNKEKSYCVDLSYYKDGGLNVYLPRKRRQQVFIPCALRNRGQGKQPEFNGSEKANSLTTVQTDSMVCAPLDMQANLPIRIGNLPGVGSGQANRIYSVRGKSICLNANGGGSGAKTGLYKIDLPDGDYSVRKLTPVECERLQTLPDGYTSGISNTQRYKCIGNGWTVDVIKHIFEEMKKDKNYAPNFNL